jgi:hypothetical protein
MSDTAFKCFIPCRNPSCEQVHDFGMMPDKVTCACGAEYIRREKTAEYDVVFEYVCPYPIRRLCGRYAADAD